MVPKPFRNDESIPRRFRAVLFRMVPKHFAWFGGDVDGFRAVLFRMVPKPFRNDESIPRRFRAVLFRMVPKLINSSSPVSVCFRAVLFRMVPKQVSDIV